MTWRAETRWWIRLQAAGLSMAAACTSAGEPVGAVKAALDGDGDGVDDSADSCPGVYNPAVGGAQPNANQDAEEALSLDPKGDECDPHPVPWQYVESYEVHGGAMGEYQDIATSPLIGTRRTADFDARVARDGLRFCLCDDALSNSTSARSGCELTDDCTIGDWLGYDNADHAMTDWKTMTVDWARPRMHGAPFGTVYDSVPAAELRSGGDEVVMDYWAADRNEASARWDIFADSEDWDVTPPCTEAYTDPEETFHPGACWDTGQEETYFRGVMAAHTPGDTDLESMPPADGFYATGTNYDAPNRNLTFNYRSGPFQRRRTVYDDPPSRNDEFYGISLLPEDECLTCSLGFPEPFFLFDRCLQGGCEVPFLRFRASYLDDASDAFHPDAYEAMGQLSNVVWVAASEPRSWRSGDGPVWAAVSDSAWDGVKGLIEWKNGALLEADVGNPQTEPGWRTDFGLALSRDQRAVYLIGGMVQGFVAGQLWTFDLDSKSWSSAQLPSGGPEVVLAAAYVPAEQALLVLDLKVTQQENEVRLLRVSLDGQSVTTLGTWDRTLGNSTFAMTSFDDGRGYAVACTDSAGDHTVLRFVRTAQGAVLDSYATSDGALISAMMGAGPLGVTVLADPSGQGVPTPAGYALAAFTSATGSTPGRCF